MTVTKHPLIYFATVLDQMTTTLKDLDMPETAALCQQAKADIDEVLAKGPKTEDTAVREMPRREGLG